MASRATLEGTSQSYGLAGVVARAVTVLLLSQFGAEGLVETAQPVHLWSRQHQHRSSPVAGAGCTAAPPCPSAPRGPWLRSATPSRWSPRRPPAGSRVPARLVRQVASCSTSSRPPDSPPLFSREDKPLSHRA